MSFHQSLIRAVRDRLWRPTYAHQVQQRFARSSALTDHLIRVTTALAVVTVACVAAITSYQHAYGLVSTHGEHGLTARLLPFTVDGLIWAASMLHWPAWPPVLASVLILMPGLHLAFKAVPVPAAPTRAAAPPGLTVSDGPRPPPAPSRHLLDIDRLDHGVLDTEHPLHTPVN